MACMFGKEIPGGFYCPLAEPGVVFHRKQDIPFCKNYEQQARCGNNEHERLIEITDDLNKSGLKLGDVDGFVGGERRGNKKHRFQK